MIETRLLCYFLAIAREQSITRAAESLNITQPTLSKQMMELEEQLGRKLFVRGKKKISLTEEGAYLQGCAQEMMRLMEKTESAFHGSERLISGDIYLGCGETSAMGFVTEVFKKVQAQYPGIRYHIYSGDAEAVMDRLDKGLLDMGLLIGPVRYEKYNYLPLPQKDIFGLLMRADNPLAEKSSVTMDDIRELPIIFPCQAYAGQKRLSWFEMQYNSLNIIGTYSLIYNATFMVEQGMGCAFCLGNLVDTQGSRSLAFRPLEPEIAVDLFMITKRYQTFSPAVKVFLKYLREEIAACGAKC